jgi:hypothetical protein
MEPELISIKNKIIDRNIGFSVLFAIHLYLIFLLRLSVAGWQHQIISSGFLIVVMCLL